MLTVQQHQVKNGISQKRLIYLILFNQNYFGNHKRLLSQLQITIGR